MPHFMIILIPYIILLNLSWIIKCLFLRNREPLNCTNAFVMVRRYACWLDIILPFISSRVRRFIVQVIFYFLWEHWAHPGYFENRILLKPALGGVCSLANYSVADEETQSNRVSDFRDFVCSLFPKATLFDLFLSFLRLSEIHVFLCRSFWNCTGVFVMVWRCACDLDIIFRLFISLFRILNVCVEVLRPSQPNGVMSSAVSLPNHKFTGQA